MNKYKKVIDYEKRETKFFGVIDGIVMEVSKDIIIDDYEKEIDRLNNTIDELKQKNNLAENILYDYLYNDDKITKEKYKQFKELKGGK